MAEQTRRVTLTWRGQEYEFSPTHDLFMRIEERCAFNRVANALAKAGSDDGRLDMPMSHVSWVLYCCLKAAGAQVRTPLDVHQDLFNQEAMPDYGATLGAMVAAYYGSTAQRAVKKKPETEAPTYSRPSTSQSDTASPSVSGESSPQNSGG